MSRYGALKHLRITAALGSLLKENDSQKDDTSFLPTSFLPINPSLARDFYNLQEQQINSTASPDPFQITQQERDQFQNLTDNIYKKFGSRFLDNILMHAQKKFEIESEKNSDKNKEDLWWEVNLNEFFSKIKTSTSDNEDKGGFKTYYNDSPEKPSNFEPQSLREVSEYATIVAQGTANALGRTIVNNFLVQLGAGGMKKALQVLQTDPRYYPRNFPLRLPYNFISIKASIEVARKVAGGKDPSEMTASEKLAAIVAGGYAEVLCGGMLIETATMFSSYFEMKARNHIAKDIAGNLNKLDDGAFWNVVSAYKVKNKDGSINSELLARLEKIYLNQDLRKYLVESGADFSAYEALKAKNAAPEEYSKALKTALNNRPVATKLAEFEGKMMNISFTSKPTMNALTENFGSKVIPTYTELTKLMIGRTPIDGIRNFPYFATIYLGLRDKDSGMLDKLLLGSVCAVLSTHPAIMGNEIANSVLTNPDDNILKNIKEAFKTTNLKIVSDPRKFLYGAAARVCGNILAVLIFDDKLATQVTEWLYNGLCYYFGVDSAILSSEEKKQIDEEVKTLVHEKDIAFREGAADSDKADKKPHGPVEKKPHSSIFKPLAISENETRTKERE